jgi:two-component system KDP operon response regulator KdpE
MSQPGSLILLVEDDPRYQKLIRINLEAAGFQVLVADHGEAALSQAESRLPDLVLLDVMLPGQLDGFEICRRLRQFSAVPIVMITAKSAEADIVTGLNLGADDYLTKPFGVAELLARVNANLRRINLERQLPNAAPVLTVGGLTVDQPRRLVTLHGEQVSLTQIEFELLAELARYAGQVRSPRQLIVAVWGSENAGSPHMLRQVMYRLRQKIEPNPKTPRLLQNRPGFGYVLAPPLL